jgi:hypothetical protein
MLARVPKWVSTDQYVINAEGEGNRTKDQMRLMMQSLLADRFKLAVHFERIESPVFAVVLDKQRKTGQSCIPILMAFPAMYHRLRLTRSRLSAMRLWRQRIPIIRS